MLESFAQLATAAKSLESFENAFQPKHSKVHNGIAPRQPQQATLPTEGGACSPGFFHTRSTHVTTE